MAPAARPIKTKVFQSKAHGSVHFKCRICVHKYHPLRKCYKFIAMNALDRKKATLQHKYCVNCLAHEHPESRTCTSKSCCHICRQKHHTMLHHSQRLGHKHDSSKKSANQPSSKPTPRESSPAHVSALSTILSGGVVSLLPTAVINVIVDGKPRAVRALLDQCCPFSRVSSALVADLKLQTISVAGHPVVTLKLQSRCTDQAQVEGQFRVGNRLSMMTPFRSMDRSVKTKFPHMFLADVEFYRSRSIALVIGSELFGKVIQEGIMTRGGLVAQNTLFGWAISGQGGL